MTNQVAAMIVSALLLGGGGMTTGEYRFEAVPETDALKELADTTVLDVER